MVMMAIKILFVVLAGILSQPALAYPTINSNASEPSGPEQQLSDDLVQVANQTLQTVTNAVNDATDGSFIAIHQVLAKLEGTKQGAFLAAKKIISQDIVDIQQIIDQVKALVDRRKFASCANDYENKFSLIQTEATNLAFKCIALVAQRVRNDTTVVIIDFARFDVAIEEAKENLENCRSDDCVKGVISELVELALFLPPRLQLDTDKTQFDFDNVPHNSAQCIIQAEDVIKERSGKIYHNIIQCLGVINVENDDNYWSFGKWVIFFVAGIIAGLILLCHYLNKK